MTPPSRGKACACRGVRARPPGLRRVPRVRPVESELTGFPAAQAGAVARLLASHAFLPRLASTHTSAAPRFTGCVLLLSLLLILVVLTCHRAPPSSSSLRSRDYPPARRTAFTSSLLCVSMPRGVLDHALRLIRRFVTPAAPAEVRHDPTHASLPPSSTPVCAFEHTCAWRSLRRRERFRPGHAEEYEMARTQRRCGLPLGPAELRGAGARVRTALFVAGPDDTLGNRGVQTVAQP